MFRKGGLVDVPVSVRCDYGDMEFMDLSDGSRWVKIFEHDCRSGTILFSDEAEVLSCDTTGKYSRLFILDHLKPSGGKFEFMLKYPDDFAGEYNRWKQTNNPFSEYVEPVDGGSTVEGYEAVNVDWTDNYWGGLNRMFAVGTALDASVLDGSVGHANGYYAVGATQSWNGGIPGPDATTPVTGRTQLYVRIDTLDVFTLTALFEEPSNSLRVFSDGIICTDFVEI